LISQVQRVAYYAHHHGSGHLRHAANVAGNPALDVLVMSSADPVGGSQNNVRFVPLPMDIVEGHRQPGGSPFLYTPVGDSAPNVRDRFRRIHEALTDFGPHVVIADVSPEVAAFAKLAGYPTIVRRMHGDRSDHAHSVMYAMADAIVAYFPEALESSEFPVEWKHKTVYAGMIEPGHFASGDTAGDDRTVVVLTSLGGFGVNIADVNAAAAQSPEWRWRVLGLTHGDADPAHNVSVLGVVNDPASEIAAASIVVTSAGHNAIGTAASANKPMLVIPEKRPFNEQQRFAEALALVSDVQAFDGWTGNWLDRLEQAAHQDASRLSRLLFVSADQFHKACNDAIEIALGG